MNKPEFFLSKKYSVRGRKGWSWTASWHPGSCVVPRNEKQPAMY